MEAYETELRERAEKNVRNRLILEAYADKVEIEVSNEDVEREMRLLAFRGKVPLKKVYELYGKNQQALAALVHSVRMEKALAHLASCVTVKEIPAGGDETRTKSEQSAEGSAAE
jgi:trigger factor